MRFSDENVGPGRMSVEEYCRDFLTQQAQAVADRFGGQPAIAFELFSR